MCHNSVGIPTYAAIETIKTSKRNYSKQDQNRELESQRFQHVACHPSNACIYLDVTNNIKDYPINGEDIQLALRMLDKSRYSVQVITLHPLMIITILKD